MVEVICNGCPKANQIKWCIILQKCTIFHLLLMDLLYLFLRLINHIQVIQWMHILSNYFFRLSSILYLPYWFKYIRLIFELIVFSRLLSLRRINDARVTNDIPSTISSTSSPSSDAQSSSNNFYDFDSKCSRCCSITSNSSSAGNTLRSHLLSYLFWVKLWYYSWKIKASHHWCRYTMLLLHSLRWPIRHPNTPSWRPMLNILFHTMMQPEDNTHHLNSLHILGEAYRALVKWLLLCMEEEEETTATMKDEVATNMD